MRELWIGTIAFMISEGRNVARFGRIDRRNRGVASRLDAILYVCHLRLVNGYRPKTRA